VYIYLPYLLYHRSFTITPKDLTNSTRYKVNTLLPNRDQQDVLQIATEETTSTLHRECVISTTRNMIAMMLRSSAMKLAVSNGDDTAVQRFLIVGLATIATPSTEDESWAIVAALRASPGINESLENRFG
jgi:hypothetical protein